MARKKTTGRIENRVHYLGPGEKPDPLSKYIQVYVTPGFKRKPIGERSRVRPTIGAPDPVVNTRNPPQVTRR